MGEGGRVSLETGEEGFVFSPLILTEDFVGLGFEEIFICNFVFLNSREVTF